jgi:signal transduction histidine kinase
MVSLEVIQGPDKGRSCSFDGEFVIGRESDLMPISDGTVSRRHSRLAGQENSWMLEDLGSVNGTFLNGVKVTRPTRLHIGDQIRCGNTLLVFGSSSDKSPAPLPLDENGAVDAAIMATVPANDDSVIIPTPEAGAEAIDNVRVLYNLATDISSIFNLDQLLQRTLDKIFDVLPADRAYVLMVGPTGELTTKASLDRSEGAAGTVPISHTIINEVITKQIGVLSSNAMRDKRFSSGKSVHAFGIRSAVAVPIKGRDKVLGVIHVDSSMADHTYSTEQLRLLTAIGYQTGLAIENVRLYDSAVQGERLAAIGETVANLSHHIKNIIQGLSGGTELVEKAIVAGDVEKARRAWPIVHRSLERVNAVILNMLAFSKPRQPLLETVNINYVLNECLDLLGPQADERGVALINDLGDLPPIGADPSGLHQVFLNLLNNALDAVASDSGIITISTEFDHMNQHVVVTVADNGAGIARDEIDHIFELFHSTKGQKGTGLGLTVCRKIVQEHGGKIDVKSEVGAGTTFTIILPAHPGANSGETRHGR